MNKNNAGFMAFLGVAAAIVVGAFFLAPNMFKTKPESASDTAPKSNMVDATASDPDVTAKPADEGLPADAARVDSPADEVSEPAAADTAFVMPSFDLLRVEPDGSTVIAGKAEPGSTLDIMNGDSVIATTQVGPSGDFAVILDSPLPAGDYQLTLRVTGKDGSVRQSEEVATVSVPETAEGDLLAMVSKPGKASRIIAQPTAPQSDEGVEAASPATGGDGQAPDTATGAGVEPSVTGSDQAAETAPATEMSDAADDGVESTAVAVATGEAETDGNAETAAVANASDDNGSGDQTPALPEASSMLTTSAPDIAEETQANASAETASSTNADAKAADSSADSGETVEVAAVAPDAATEAASDSVPGDANVRVDAVEIEGDRIFIAGSATPGYQVRVTADGQVIGSDTADESGRFIVEATTELAVGDHFINADLMDKAGETVLLRATVPFNRPEGEALAAVAPSEATETGTSAAGQQAAASAPGELVLPDIASLSKMRESAFEALSELKQMASSSEPPESSAMATALERAVDKLKSASIADLPADSSEEAKAIAQSMRIQAGSALGELIQEPAVESADTGNPAEPEGDTMIARLATGDMSKVNEMVAKAETALSEPADMTIASAVEPGEAAVSQGQPGEPKTILQAPLASTPGAVIIRRGDTLWQISRRTYGEGVRYTTIYVANRSQIQDPDRIKPGQVFSVPEDPLENAEELHQQLLDKGKTP